MKSTLEGIRWEQRTHKWLGGQNIGNQIILTLAIQWAQKVKQGKKAENIFQNLPNLKKEMDTYVQSVWEPQTS